ncbi:ribonuclease h2, subunit c [Niveomyces insectorum RCEF 264]|uniref:Ribonuclease h2, subunit c n=1 Tax=Niveomyces insectorum RCEF 264 TaxID=1081102 RepID=A0A168A6U5_9HYPO|nr:ribonuclease h2, subunit c [Niveomyces insectorum RCEF 264]
MAQPMLQITADKASGPPAQAKPHLLPCRIHHSGPVGPTEAFWEPKATEDGKTTAYFRGRKLHGHAVKVPNGYRGVVGARRESPREQARRSNQPEEVIDVDAGSDEQAAQQQQLDTGELVVLAEFGELVVWGHQNTADATTDPYVRGINEWMALAEEVRFICC